MKASADSVGTMGTLEAPRIVLKFDRTAQGWLAFKQSMLKWTDSQNVGYMLEGGQGICIIFQAASVAAAKLKYAKLKAKATGAPATISLDIEAYAEKEIEAELKKPSVLTGVALAVRGNRKEKPGVNWADAMKCGMFEDDLIEAHNVLDVLMSST
jgi:hypothetical protein